MWQLTIAGAVRRKPINLNCVAAVMIPVGSRPSGDCKIIIPPLGVINLFLKTSRTVGSVAYPYAAVDAEVCAGQPRTCLGVCAVEPVPAPAAVPETHSHNTGTAVAVTPSKLIATSTIEGWFAVPTVRPITVLAVAAANATAPAVAVPPVHTEYAFPGTEFVGRASWIESR